MNRICAFSLPAFAVVLLGCYTYYADPGPDLAAYEYVEYMAPEASAFSAYFPLGAGSEWTYAGVGNEYAPFSRRVVYQRENLAQMREDTGGTVMAKVYRVEPDAVRLIYAQEEAYGDSDMLSAPPNQDQIVLKAPLMAGTTWSNGAERRTIVDDKARVETPGGIYSNCLEIESRSQGSTAVIREFYCPRIGLVERIYQDGDFTVVSYLTDHTVMQPVY